MKFIDVSVGDACNPVGQLLSCHKDCDAGLLLNFAEQKVKIKKKMKVLDEQVDF